MPRVADETKDASPEEKGQPRGEDRRADQGEDRISKQMPGLQVQQSLRRSSSHRGKGRHKM